MDTYTLNRFVGDDGILHLDLPVRVTSTEVEVVIVVQKSQDSPTKMDSKHVPKHVAEIRKKYSRAYEPWTTSEEKRLLQLHDEDQTVDEISKILQRQPGAIRSRLNKITLHKDL